MADSFNPYHQWLGLPLDLTSPSYYQILGVAECEADAAKIIPAADRALTRVRSFKPGPNAREWSRLLDEINSAKDCLLDPAVKAEYDRCLLKGSGRSAPSGGDKVTATAERSPAKAPVNVDRLPPGMAPAGVKIPAPAAQPQPSVAMAPAAQTSPPVNDLLPPSVDHLLPTAAYAQPVPVVDPTAAGMIPPPGWGAPPSAYALPAYPPPGYGAAPTTVDPMAPAGMLPMPAASMPMPAQPMYPVSNYAAPAPMYPAAMPAPVPAIPESPALAIGGGQSALAAVNARKAARAQRNLIVAAVAGCLLVAAGAIVFANRHAILAQLDPQQVAQNPIKSNSNDTSGDYSASGGRKPPEAAPPVEENKQGSKPDEPKTPQPAPAPMPDPTPPPMLEPAPPAVPETKSQPKPELTPPLITNLL